MKKCNKNETPQLILASASPRRSELLAMAGLRFSVIPNEFDESSIPLSEPSHYVKVLAEAKAHDVAKGYPGHWVIGADTIVVLGDTILGKPESREDAVDMLESLSGNAHKVLTGYCICCLDKGISISTCIQTEVLFKEISAEEILWYTSTEEPYDKAGSYAIQGIGAFLVKEINGSYTNVVGLPVCEVLESLTDLGTLRFDHNRDNKIERTIG